MRDRRNQLHLLREALSVVRTRAAKSDEWDLVHAVADADRRLIDGDGDVAVRLLMGWTLAQRMPASSTTLSLR